MSAHPDPFTARERLFSHPGVVVKATMLPSSIAALATDVVRLGGTAVIQATGIMFARFSEMDALDAVPRLYGIVEEAGDGSLTLLRMPQQLASLRHAQQAPALMSEIKRQFDPKRTLNPGRFVGGI
jgi:glycolate oxidase FAD binding subunit